MTDKQQKIYFVIIFALFLVAPFCMQTSIGGTGLALSYNIASWFAATIFIFVGIWITLRRKSIIYALPINYLLAFLGIAVLAGFLSGVEQPFPWILRLCYIAGGILYLVTLLQFNLSQKQIEQTLWLILTAMFFHALSSILQANPSAFLVQKFPLLMANESGGIFRHRNLLASYLTTGILIILYLISRPSYKFCSIYTKFFTVIFFAITSYVVFSTGSRLGLLSLLISLIMIAVSHRRRLLRNKCLVVILLLVLTGSLILAQHGVKSVVTKLKVPDSKTLSQTDQGLRINMYRISSELILDKPLLGHGFGNLLPAWHDKAIEFKRSHPEALYSMGTVSHPHNEVFYWFIEGGIVAVLGLSLAMLGIFSALKYCGLNRGLNYGAILLPIFLHTQVEFPFYTSSVHWFTWLFVVFMVFRHSIRIYELNISRAMNKLVQYFSIFAALLICVFLVNTAKAQKDIYSFLHDSGSKPPYLKIALNNMYFRTLAEDLAYKAMLLDAISNNNDKQVDNFITLREKEILLRPNLSNIYDLSQAYEFLGSSDKLCTLLNTNLLSYPQSKELLEIHQRNCLTKPSK